MIQLRIDGSTLVCPGHPLHLQQVTIGIQNKTIAFVASGPHHAEAEKVINADGMHCSAGFTDLFATVPSPGAEYRETHASAGLAALRGGYTRVLVHSDLPGSQSGAQGLLYVQDQSVAGMQFLPMAHVSKHAEGKELAELYDAQLHGAAAFGDGRKPVQQPELLLKALQYAQPTGKPIIQLPLHPQIGRHGLMHEGVASTRFGMPGIPAMAEWAKLQADLGVHAYSGGKLHFTGLSTAHSLSLVQEAMSRQPGLSYSLCPWHLLYTDEDLHSYDTHLKMEPCLRSQADREALVAAVSGTERLSIASHHLPQNTDAKDCEFEYAKPGNTSLQTCFHALLKAAPNIEATRLANLLAYYPQEVLGLATNFAENSAANLTLFTLSGHTPFTLSHNASRSTNNPLLNTALPGRIMGTYNRGHLHLNP